MSAIRTGFALAFLACLACDCASAPPPPRPEAEGLAQQEILRAFRDLRVRVRDLSYTLRARARRLCGEVLLPDAALLLGTADGFGDASRQLEIEAAYDMADGINVLHVVPGTPLHSAGVRAGDVLRTLDGQALSSIADYNARLLGTDAAPVELGFERRGEPFAVRTHVPRVCGVPVHFSDDTGLMTFQQGYSVAVPFGLLELVEDDALAIAIAHQMAHVLLGFASEPVEDPERTADRLGLLIAAEAGFDVSAAPGFWVWLASEDPWRIPSTQAFRLSRPHPTLPGVEITYPTDQLHLGIAGRLPAIRAIVDEIRAVQAVPPDR